MFNPIRELISENKIAQALAACSDLELKPANRSQLISLRRRWSMLADEDIAQTREQRLLKLEGNAVVDDLLKWLDQMEYAPAKEEWSVKVTHTKEGGGAAAGAKLEPAKSNARWLWIGTAIIALLAVTWMAWPEADPDSVAVNPTRELPQNPPSETPTRENPPADPPPNPGKTKVNPGDLVVTTPGKVDLSKVDVSAIPLNKDIRLNSDALRKLAAANALMTSGDQVDIAVAVYRNTTTPTKYDAATSKSLAAYLQREMKDMDIAYNVLTQKFHDHEMRDRLHSHGTFKAGELNAARAHYLLLVDVRGLRTGSKYYMRLCLYDVNRGKGFPENKIYAGKASTSPKSKELYSYASEYLKLLKERGLLK